MANQEFQDFKSKAGGPWAISWQAYAISFPISLFAAFGAISKLASNTSQLLLSLLVAALTVLALGALLAVLDKTTYRNRRTQPVGLVVMGVSGLIAGVVFSLGIAAGKTLLGADFFDDLWSQIAANSILIAWWGATIALVLDSRDVFSRQRAAVVENAIELELVNLRGSATEQRLRETLNKKISSQISDARTTLNAAVNAAEQDLNDPKWQPIAELMRTIANDVMRPLSKKLWNSAAAVFPKPSFWQVLKTIFSSQPLRPAPMTVIVILLSTSTLINAFGAITGTQVLLATVAFVWVSMPLASFAMKRLPKFHALFFALTVLSFQAFDTGVWIWARNQAQVEVSFGTLAVNVVASLILILLTSGYGAYGNVGEANLQAFRKDVSNKQLSVLVKNKVISTLALEASRNLHGQVQTRLLSCAAAIDRATKNGDLELLNRALVEVNEIFDGAAIAKSEDVILPLQQQLFEITKNWLGLCQINLHLDSTLEASADKTSADVADVVEEAITNAVRHGKATQVDIRVEDLGKKIGITVTDNGSGLTESTPGVGTELIRLVSQGDFSLANRTLGGAELQVSVLKTG